MKKVESRAVQCIVDDIQADRKLEFVLIDSELLDGNKVRLERRAKNLMMCCECGRERRGCQCIGGIFAVKQLEQKNTLHPLVPLVQEACCGMLHILLSSLPDSCGSLVQSRQFQCLNGGRYCAYVFHSFF